MNSTWKKVAFAVLVAGLCLAAFKLGESLFGNHKYRDPASTGTAREAGGEFDFSSLASDAFISAAQDRIVNTANFSLDEAGNGLFDMGLFLGPENAIVACATYTDIVLTLKGEGIAVSGEAPLIQVFARCETTEDGTELRLKPIVIPFTELLRLPAHDQKLEYTQYDVNIDLVNFAGDWAPEWYVSEIRMTQPEQTSAVVVTAADLRKDGRLLQVSP